jgi:hypothetical protein
MKVPEDELIDPFAFGFSRTALFWDFLRSKQTSTGKSAEPHGHFYHIGGSKSPGISSQMSSLQRQIAELKKLIPREGTSATRLNVVENQVHKVSVQVNENTAELVRLKKTCQCLV